MIKVDDFFKLKDTLSYPDVVFRCRQIYTPTVDQNFYVIRGYAAHEDVNVWTSADQVEKINE